MATPKKILCVPGDINFLSRTPRDTTPLSGSLSYTLEGGNEREDTMTVEQRGRAKCMSKRFI